MIINASSRRGIEKDIPKHIAGIVFLGTPHRGSASSNWGSLIVQSGKVLGLDGEDRILNDLKRDSETLKQVVREFTRWLFDNSVPTVCFYEQHMTDYGSKAGVPFFTWKEMVCTIQILLGCLGLTVLA
jgi:protein SERAC1